MTSFRQIFEQAVRQYPEGLQNPAVQEACEAMIDRYPYFVVPYVMRAMAAHSTDDLSKWEAVMEAALRVPNRATFRRRLIHMVAGTIPTPEIDENHPSLNEMIDSLRPPTNSPSIGPDDSLVTETMAHLFEIQGAIDDAIRCYQILMKKNPEKRRYFAERIKSLENNKNNHSQ